MMMRRRRQSLPGGGGDALSMEGSGIGVKPGLSKLKMSPFPEVKGVPLKESSERLNRLSEVKTSLQFPDLDSTVEIGTSASLSNTPLPHPLRQAQTHITSASCSNPPPSNTECNQTEQSLTDSLYLKVKGQMEDATVDCEPNSDSQSPRIRIPRSEYVVPHTLPHTCSSNEVDMSSFPPSLVQDGANGRFKCDDKVAMSANFDVKTESTIKPSTVLELERQLTPKVARQQTNSADGFAGTSVAGRQQTDNQSASIKGMWDSVVTWMKQAVDFVTVDDTVEDADPTTTPNVQGKKRPHPNSDISDDPSGAKFVKLTNAGSRRGERGVVNAGSRRGERGVVSGTRSKRNSRRMSFGGFLGKQATTSTRPNEEGLGQLLSFNLLPTKESTSSNESNNNRGSDQSQSVSINPTDNIAPSYSGTRPPFISPTSLLAQQFSHNLAVKSPQENLTPLPGSAVTNSSLFTFAAKRYQSTNDGLNSILDGSPLAGPKFGARRQSSKIRRQSLRKFYGRSVNSPNLTEVPEELKAVRRSPRLAESSSRTPPARIPVPPPPPPLPTTPHTRAPPPPPTPKLPALYDCDLSSTPGRGIDQSRYMLQKMQSRLRTRMKKKAVGGEESGNKERKSKEMDLKGRQWAEIQALSRKVSLSDFLAMADSKKQEIKRTLEELRVRVPGTIAEITATLEILHDASQWFSGGNKEMRDALPLYKSLEKKIEVLNEFTQVCSQIRQSNQAEMPEGIHYSNLHSTLSHIRSDFDAKHRHWGPVVLTNAQSWLEVGLPVCHKLILRARQYLCHLVETFVRCTLMEADKIKGILLSLKCVRTRQVKERLRECMHLLRDSQPYFQTIPFEQLCDSCELCQTMSFEHEESVNYLSSTLLKFTVDVSLSYVNIGLGQFDGFVRQSERQEVCEHFESILKMINLVKSLVCAIKNIKPSQVEGTGVIFLLPDGESVGTVIYTSCVTLIQHIMSKTKTCVSQGLSPGSVEKVSKEIILWMMFGCKYVHQTLEVLGSEIADERGVGNLLGELQQLENLLPN